MDLPDNMHTRWSQSQNVNKITAAKNSNQNSSNILDTVLEVAETGVDVVRLMPHQKVQHIQSALEYFTVLVEIVDELTRSLEIETSSNFIDHLSDVLGAVLLNVAQEATPTGKNVNRQPSGRRLCDPEYFLKNISTADWKNTKALQNYACRISKVMAQRRSSGYEGDEWQFPSDKIRRIFSQRTSSEIQHNIKRWENEDNVSNPRRTGLLSPHQTENETSVDDLISAAECAIQGLKDILVQVDNGSNSTNENTLKVSEDVSKQADDLKEKWVLTSISRVKEVAKDFRGSPLMQMNLSNFDLQKMLSTVYSMLNKATAHNPAGVSATANELVRLLPAFLFVSRELNTNATLINGIPNLISAFVDDLEPLVWKSISPDNAEDFTKTDVSKNFCIYVSRSAEIHWKGMLCEKDTSAFKLYLPRESVKKQVNFTKYTSSNWNTRTKFDSQTLARILLELSSSIGSVFKVMAKILKEVPGCENTCGNDDVVLKKICFLSRLQNVKSIMDNDSADTEDNVINELRPYFTLNENILEAYNLFVDTAHSTASNNYTDDRDIVRLVVSGVRLLESLGGEEHTLRPALHVANSLISLLKNRVSDAAMYNETSVVQIQNVFPDSPLTQELASNLLPLLPEVTSTFLWTVLAPGELLNLVSANDKNISVIMAAVCNSSLSRYLYNPTLDQAGFRKLSGALCRHSYYDIFEEIFQDPDIQEIVFEAGNTDEVTWEDMQENLLDIIDLLEELAAVRKADLSALPPPTKWQKMGINIYTKAQDPSVLLYIVTNRMFHVFCNYTSSKLPSHLQSFISRDKEIALYHELCSMSKESFAKKVVRNLNQTIKASSPNSMQSFDVINIAQRFWETLADISEIKRIAKFVLDLDLLDHYETAGLSAAFEAMEKRKIFQNKIMNATLRAYNMVDKMTDGMLSSVILDSAVPEVMQQISSYVIESGGHINLRTVFENEKDSRRLLSSLFQNDPERKKLESYIDILAEYFSRLENLSILKTLCNEHQKNKRLYYTADNIIKKLCLQPPLEWSPISLTENKHNLTALWLQVSGLINLLQNTFDANMSLAKFL
ncbi:uncharacterized protein LOC118181871 [Stegodyphus dumicola]|uniref:uncharacterized protein LOC118181871 n=1 Tax=Stegodyphus dumicola TaxID=202533 RepID=UPI0015A9A45E|nr:uncharacterized protein LOC118181871 [Stegodyphus dumicola]